MSEGVVLYSRPPGPGVGVELGGVGETGGKCRRGACAAAGLCGLSVGKLRQLPTSTLCLAVASPTFEERETDVGPKFDEV